MTADPMTTETAEMFRRERDTAMAERDRLRVTGDRMARAILDYEVGQGRASWDELLAARSAWLALANQEEQA